MSQLDFERIEKVSQATVDTVERMIDELEIAEVERKVYKSLILSMIRSERLDAAIVIQESYTKERMDYRNASAWQLDVDNLN